MESEKDKESCVAFEQTHDAYSTSTINYGHGGDKHQRTPSFSSNRSAGAWIQFKDSFKPCEPIMEEDDEVLEELDEITKQNYLLSRQPLKRKLKSRHLQMISIGGTIGTGLFIGVGYALSSGGPAAVLIGFTLVGFSMYCVVQALGEIAVVYPVSGSFATHIGRFVDPALGFTISTNYALSWLISLPSELIGCSMTIQYWNSDINPAVWVAVFYVTIVIINLFGIRGYGEAEFIFSIIKVIAVVIFLIVGVILICGGGPTGGYIGGKYWHDPGAFNDGFKGVCSVFISAAFSFGGTELVGLAAAETENPRVTLPKAIKQVFWRITIFYISTVIIIGCLVRYDDPRLLDGSTSEDITASPFVIAIKNGGIKGLDQFMNAVILVAVLSVGNSCVYGSSRVIQALGASGQLPKVFGYVDRSGRPLGGIILSLLIGLLGFLVSSSNEDTVFTWLFSICSISSFFTWFCICFTHIRFRNALKKQGRSTDELPFTAQLGLIGSYCGCIINFLIIVGEIWISAYPVGEHGPDAETFFQNCLSIPLMIVVWASYKTYYKQWNFLYLRGHEVDLATGRKGVDIDLLKQEIAEEKAIYKSKPFYYKVYKFFC